MKSRKLLSNCICALALAAFCTAASAAKPAPSAIKVGMLYASSGIFAPISMPIYKGMKIWVKNVNAHGGVFVKPYNKKLPVKLIAYNDQSSTATAATLYNRLITQDHVNLLIADSGSVLTSVGVPIAREHKMLLLDQSGTSAKFFDHDNPYIVLLGLPVSKPWSRDVAGFITNVASKHGIRKIAILYSNNDFGGALADSFRDHLKHADNAGIKIVYDHGVPTSTSSYTVLLHRIQASHPDAIVELGYPGNDIAFLRDLHSSGMHFPMIFTIFSGMSTKLLEKNAGPDAMDGTFTYVTAVDLDYKPDAGMNVAQFRQAYQNAYGNKKVFGINSIIGYNTGIVIQEMLKNTRDMSQLGLRDAAFALSGKLTTLEGHFKLDKSGAQVGMLMPIGQVHANGSGGVKLVPVYPQAMAQAKPVWKTP